MTLITAIINFKGGVAKTTTTTTNLSMSLRKMKGRVMMIDTDPEGNIITPSKAKA